MTGQPRPHPLELNLWALNRDLARIPGSSVHDDPELLWFTCPGGDSWLNGASRCGRGLDEAVVARAVATWDELGAAAIWHETPAASRSELAGILTRHGFEPNVAPGMAMTLDRAFEPAPRELRIEEITTPAGVLDWANTFDIAFGGEPRGLEHPWLEPFAALYLGDDPPGRMFLGRVEGVPVSTSLAFHGGGAVGIYGVGTIPDRRGRGYGAALTLAGIAWGRRRGADLAVLEATEPGLPVYERLGFKTLFETTGWFRRPSRAIKR